MTVDAALKAIATRPADRWNLDGFGETWDMETCAEVLADEVDRLRDVIYRAKDCLETWDTTDSARWVYGALAHLQAAEAAAKK
jgi:hypothetical protein